MKLAISIKELVLIIVYDILAHSLLDYLLVSLGSNPNLTFPLKWEGMLLCSCEHFSESNQPRKWQKHSSFHLKGRKEDGVLR